MDLFCRMNFYVPFFYYLFRYLRITGFDELDLRDSAIGGRYVCCFRNVYFEGIADLALTQPQS